MPPTNRHWLEYVFVAVVVLFVSIEAALAIRHASPSDTLHSPCLKTSYPHGRRGSLNPTSQKLYDFNAAAFRSGPCRWAGPDAQRYGHFVGDRYFFFLEDRFFLFVGITSHGRRPLRDAM
jgi:hypothetical protein